jgi:HEAT repeat protein
VKTRDRVLWFVFIPLAGLATYLVGPYLYYGVMGLVQREPFYGLLPRSYYLKHLRTGDSNERVAALRAMGYFGKEDRSTIPREALIAALRDEDASVRSVAAWAIGLRPWDAEKTIPALGDSLRDDDETVRLAAVRSLTYIAPHDDAALVALAAAVSSGDEGVRQIASHSLQCLGSQAKPAIAPLRAALHHKDKAVREAAEETLKEIEAEVGRDGGLPERP